MAGDDEVGRGGGREARDEMEGRRGARRDREELGWIGGSKGLRGMNDPAHAQHSPLSRPAGQVTSLIHNAACLEAIVAEWIWHKFLLGELGSFEITSCDAHAAQVQLSRHAHGLRLHVFIEHEAGAVRQRSPDADLLGIGEDVHAGRVDGALCRPVTILENEPRPPVPPELQR